MYDVQNVNYLFALGTLALQAITVALLGAFFLRSRIPAFNDVVRLVSVRGLLIALVVSFVATVCTLFYSDVLGVEPCPLCWWQRIFLYPQVILFALALWKRDRIVVDYSIALSIIGAGIALYQHVLQMLPGSGLPCPATGVSCAQRILFEFGYITFPLMAFSLFVFLIVVMLCVRLQRNL